MINQLAWSITNFFVRNNEISDEDGEIYAFGFECMLATIMQIIILALVGLIFECLIEITIYSICFTRIKGYIGGYHANTHLTCIGGYTLVALGAIYLVKIIPYWTSIYLVIAALILILKLAPIQHYNNPKTDEEIIKGRKQAILMSLIISILIMLLYLSPFSKYAIFGACGFFLASTSLLFPNREVNP